MLTPTSELDAVNAILQTVGELPVNSLDGDLPSDAPLALNTLHEVARELQLRGWYWNTEVGVELTPNQDGHVLLPSNTIRAECNDGYDRRLPVQRGNKLYDLKARSYVFDAPVKDVQLTLILPFDQMPEAARNLCAIRSARRFHRRFLTSQLIEAVTEADEGRAMAMLLDDELRVTQPNMLSNPMLAPMILR